MKELHYEFSKLGVLEFILIAILLFMGLRMAKQYLNIYVTKKQWLPFPKRLFPVLEFIIWMTFFVWSVEQVFQTGISGSMILLGVMAGILTWACSFVIRDWITGVIFKAEDNYQLEDMICFQDTWGKLKHLGYRTLTLETQDGTASEIAYSTFVKENLIQRITQKTVSHAFQLSIPSHVSFPEIMQQIQAAVLCAPWSSLTQSPQIKLIGQQEDQQYPVEVVIHALDYQYISEIEAYVKRHVTVHSS
ncbi:MAG: mechanosensitive ion channel [SAR324 cluster bacterium]|nr:mechanosensitive ion channel [SAR324 cluster bacterium]